MPLRMPDTFTLAVNAKASQDALLGVQNYATHLSYVIGDETQLIPPFAQGGTVVGELTDIQHQLPPQPGP